MKTALRWRRRRRRKGLCGLEVEEETCVDSHRTARGPSDALLEGNGCRASPLARRRHPRKINETTTAEKCNSQRTAVFAFRFKQRGRRLSLRSLCVLFTALRWSWQASTFVCLFLLHLGDGAEAIEVMTWLLHLGNHFHIQQKRSRNDSF